MQSDFWRNRQEARILFSDNVTLNIGLELVFPTIKTDCQRSSDDNDL